jgi:predicted ArsR family transcriptional regulator
MDEHDEGERRTQIIVLLAYPRVGSLSTAAIAINLGVPEREIRITLESLLRDGEIVQTSDGRLTSRSARPQAKTTISGIAGTDELGREKRESG